MRRLADVVDQRTKTGVTLAVEKEIDLFIYFCESCKKFEAFRNKIGNYTCPDCEQPYIALGVNLDE